MSRKKLALIWDLLYIINCRNNLLQFLWKYMLPLILYSTQSWIAFALNEEFYGHYHYVWCSPFLNPEKDATTTHFFADTSVPGKIYKFLNEEAHRKTASSQWIKRNKVGLLNGVKRKRAEKVIDAKTSKALIQYVMDAAPLDFRPVLYIIPSVMVKKIVEVIAPGKGAHPLSVEYRIHRLPRKLFDVQVLPSL
jgi:hypothetical protein